jgi:sigma-E factor negative regulatory protein RseC
MIETQAVVIRVEGRLALIEAERRLGCGRCKETGCGSAVPARLVKLKPRRLHIVNSIAAKRGDAVIVGISERALLKSALSVYLVPIMLLILGAVLGAAGGPAGVDRYALAGALLGLIAGAAWIREFTRHAGACLAPVIRLQTGVE